MKRVLAYFTNPEVILNTRTCRFKKWAHDNAFTQLLILGTGMIGWIVTIIQCHS